MNVSYTPAILYLSVPSYLVLFSCDGGCRRSFHPTKEHGEDSMCATLGLTEEQWKMHEALGVYFD
jgi:hypothetical protein